MLFLHSFLDSLFHLFVLEFACHTVLPFASLSNIKLGLVTFKARSCELNRPYVVYILGYDLIKEL